MKEIEAVIPPFMVEEVVHRLAALDDLPGVTISEVAAWGESPGSAARRRSDER